MSNNYYFKLRHEKVMKNEIITLLNKNNINFMIKEDILLPKIKICHTALGWYPIFIAGRYFRNMEQLNNFYNKNILAVTVVDDYNEEISFERLIEQIQRAYKQELRYEEGFSYLDNKYSWMEE